MGTRNEKQMEDSFKTELFELIKQKSTFIFKMCEYQGGTGTPV